MGFNITTGEAPPPPKKKPARGLRMRSVFVIFFPPIFLLALYFSLMKQAPPPPKDIAKMNRRNFLLLRFVLMKWSLLHVHCGEVQITIFPAIAKVH